MSNTKTKKKSLEKTAESFGHSGSLQPTGPPVVGIGASAGGLEALGLFFSHVISPCSLTFVVIQHLEPTHKSIMASLLKKYTSMEIVEISDGMAVKNECVFLAPANINIELAASTFHFRALDKSRGVNLPIDFFFRSLAQTQGARAIGIILSGTGTDGTLGLQAIKEAGGMAMVQQEMQAKYSGMPTSAINTGIVDFVLPVEKMPEQLVKYINHPYIDATKTAPKSDGDFQTNIPKILALIHGRTGHDFSLYKTSSIRRRIERRMALHQMEQVADYTGYLDKNPDEIELLFKELLINVTRFFRDPQAFETLYKKGILGLFESKAAGSSFRIWVTGCSTGEEAYSLAMLLVEEMEKRKVHLSLQIFASDLDAEAIEKARQAVYPDSICADVSPTRLNRFFTKDGKTFRVKKQIRKCVVFALHDMAKDPPFSRMDLISCRNVLIYMDQALQKKVLSMFHSSLLDHGVLFLGSSESIGELSGQFSALDTKWKIYKRKGISRRRAAAVVLPGRLPSAKIDNSVFPDKNSVKSHKYQLQKTNEELQTAIEEFQSTNEELQSAIEELETSKEELQSTNEELVTVNAELQRTVDQLTQADAEIKNLLANTEVASIFLDLRLRIIRFTPSMSKIFRLLQSDIGRSLRDITSNISAFNIYAAIDAVITSQIRKEFEVESEVGLWFTLRIVPFKTIDDVVNGVVVTFLEITIKRPSKAPHKQNVQQPSVLV